MSKSCLCHPYAPNSIPKRQRSLYRCTFLKSSALSSGTQRKARIMIYWVNSLPLNIKNSTVCAWPLFRSLFHSPHILLMLAFHTRKQPGQCRPHISVHITAACCGKITWRHSSCELTTVIWNLRAERIIASARRFKHCTSSLFRKWTFFIMKHFSITWQSMQHSSCGPFHILTTTNSWSWKRPVNTMQKQLAKVYRARAAWSSLGGLSLACQQTSMWHCSWWRSQVWEQLMTLNKTPSGSEQCWPSQICVKKPTEAFSKIFSIFCWGQEWNFWLISIRRWWSSENKIITEAFSQTPLQFCKMFCQSL